MATSNKGEIDIFVEWFKKQGGICNVDVEDDQGCRGLFTKDTQTEFNTLLVKVPNHLILSLPRIGSLWYEPQKRKYAEVFSNWDM